jgi:hypothetical protein
MIISLKQRALDAGSTNLPYLRSAIKNEVREIGVVPDAQPVRNFFSFVRQGCDLGRFAASH